MVRGSHVMNFRFKDRVNLLCFPQDEENLNLSGLQRFTPCPITTTLVRYWQTKEKYKNASFEDFSTSKKEKYVISTAVNHNPHEWCGPDNIGQGTHPQHPNRKNVFDCLDYEQMTDLQKGNAMLVLDQSHEGYQTEWLWSWFHNSCEMYLINPKAVVYVTGNCRANEQYTAWANTHGLVNRIKVIPHTHFENMIHVTAVNEVRIHKKDPLPTFEDHMAYKATNDCKTFNALQKRVRPHRTWLFKTLYDHDLVDKGLCSMNEFQSDQTFMETKGIDNENCLLYNRGLPLKAYGVANNEKDDGYYITRFNSDVVLDTYVSVVSEASFADADQTCFLSEKTFKSIACEHPFIVFGNRDSLRYLKEFGYKTFHPFIDETYDTLPTWERLNAIAKELQRIDAIEDKLEWFAGMEDILKHNRKVLKRNSEEYLPDSMIELINYYKEYFHVEG